MAKKTTKKKSRRKPIKLSVIVCVSYEMNGAMDIPLEERLERNAALCGGDIGDSGAGFGVRDIGFLFSDIARAQKFLVALRKFSKVTVEEVEVVGWGD